MEFYCITDIRWCWIILLFSFSSYETKSGIDFAQKSNTKRCESETIHFVQFFFVHYPHWALHIAHPIFIQIISIRNSNESKCKWKFFSHYNIGQWSIIEFCILEFAISITFRRNFNVFFFSLHRNMRTKLKCATCSSTFNNFLRMLRKDDKKKSLELFFNI